MTLLETKYTFCLTLKHQQAIVIAQSGDAAKRRIILEDGNLDWGNADISAISNVRYSQAITMWDTK